MRGLFLKALLPQKPRQLGLLEEMSPHVLPSDARHACRFTGLSNEGLFLLGHLWLWATANPVQLLCAAMVLPTQVPR